MDDTPAQILGESRQDGSEWVLELDRIENTGWLRLNKYWEYRPEDGPSPHGAPSRVRIVSKGYSIRLATRSSLQESELREPGPSRASNAGGERTPGVEEQDPLQEGARVGSPKPQTPYEWTGYMSALPSNNATRTLPDASQVPPECAHDWIIHPSDRHPAFLNAPPPKKLSIYCSRCRAWGSYDKTLVPAAAQPTSTSVKPDSKPSSETSASGGQPSALRY